MLEGLEGNDALYGYAGNDVLEGGAGNDNLNGYAGNDVLKGGAGDDILKGGAGDDTYHWGLGDGNDIINDYDNIDRGNSAHKDTVVFGAGIGADDIAWSGVGKHLVAQVMQADGNVQSLTIKDWFSHSQYRVEEFQLFDGSVIDTSQLNLHMVGTQSNEYVVGDAGNDLIKGMEGNDYLYGYAGNDTLEGGSGSDHLYGGAGQDAASYESSGAGVNINLVTASATGGDAQGDIFKSIENLLGSSHNDEFVGDAGANKLEGGLGNDTLTGGGGSDIFVFGALGGTGVLDTDTITDFNLGVSGDVIDVSELLSYTSGDTLSDYINVLDNGTDVILTIDHDGLANGISYTDQTIVLNGIGTHGLTLADFETNHLAVI